MSFVPISTVTGFLAMLEKPPWKPDGVTVGRGNDCTLPIDDDYASTHHAEFSPGIDGAWFVEDLASTNGTHVNGERIENPTRLSVGDEVRIGRTTMTVTGRR